MELSFSVLARDRQFAKVMRRVRPKLTPILAEFAKADLSSATHEAILVGITDDQGPEFFKEVPNKDGYFQVLVGCKLEQDDARQLQHVLGILHRATTAYAFSDSDRNKVEHLFKLSEGGHA